MSKEEYYKWIEENDTYPEHSHKWIVRTYTGGELFYRNFGTFETKEEALAIADAIYKLFKKN
jgi:hypothetical protein